MRLILFSIIIFFIPFVGFAANPDLSISVNDIRFSKEVLIAGQTIRLYARIQNVGDVDMSGYITFFQGNTILGNSQVVSLVSGGVPDEVYIDFLVPAGEFNIRAEIRGTDPQDVFSGNDVAITGKITPVFDADLDGIPDKTDNCPDQPNVNQQDTDGDGVGDLCDQDDDNDGLSDEIESELGSNSTTVDTDGDGVNDPQDAYPTDATKQKLEPPQPVQKVFEQIVDQVAKSIQKEDQLVENPQVFSLQNSSDQISTEKEQAVLTEPLTFSPNASFAYSHDSWNTFTFRVTGSQADDYFYEWDFGDGVRSNKSQMTHVYPVSGAYTVSLTVTDADGQSVSDSTVILVPFFSLYNKWVVGIIGLLIVLLGVSSWRFWVSLKKEEHV